MTPNFVEETVEQLRNDNARLRQQIRLLQIARAKDARQTIHCEWNQLQFPRVVVIAALFVDPRGCYAGLPNVDLWPESRDARLYEGPHPVVAHPPCARWCRLAGLVEKRWGHKRGDDGGCFESALASVRRWGGVLEHPAYSRAWARFGLPSPPANGGWLRTLDGGWVAHVEQGRYGHPAKKATWLYAVRTELPSLRWGSDPDTASRALVSWCGNHTKAFDRRKRVGRKSSATPIEFRDALIAMAKSVP